VEAGKSIRLVVENKIEMKMKKNRLLCFLILWAGSIWMAEAQENKQIFSAGLGVLPGRGVHVSYDYSIAGLGKQTFLGLGGYWGTSIGDGYGLDGGSGIDFWESKSLLAPRVSIQHSVNQKFELYAALMPGISMERIHHDKTQFGFFAGITAGGRIKLFKSAYLFSELGYNVLALNVGLSFRF
jgi:hypothetical protein